MHPMFMHPAAHEIKIGRIKLGQRIDDIIVLTGEGRSYISDKSHNLSKTMLGRGGDKVAMNFRRQVFEYLSVSVDLAVQGEQITGQVDCIAFAAAASLTDDLIDQSYFHKNKASWVDWFEAICARKTSQMPCPNHQGRGPATAFRAPEQFRKAEYHRSAKNSTSRPMCGGS